MKKTSKKSISLLAAFTVAAGLLSGCGGQSAQVVNSAHGGPYEETITIDVFDSQANFQGMQSGWFAKIVKDKFNMEMNIIAPNVAGGGDTLYQTRSANGNLGDLIIINVDKNRLKDMVTAGLVLDMTDYMAECEHLNQYQKAIQDASALAGEDHPGMWAVPSEVSNEPATEPCEAVDPTNAPSVRWDIYGAIGYPKMSTLEDLLDVLKQMQENTPTSDSGKKAYALSLFKDWDGDMMQNAAALAALYGYESNQGFALMNSDTQDIQSIIDDNSAYIRALHFLFEANQMGLVDPESTTQNFDMLNAKYQDGAVLYSFWPWLGSGYYNTVEHMAEGKGFQTATIDDMKCLSYGSFTLGKMENAIMVGSQAKDPQRIVDFIDWLYSPEGVETSCAQSGTNCGPEGLTWELVDGEPKLTDFGVEALVKMTDGLQVPEEWGTGTWKEGISALNYKALGVVDCDQTTGMCYNYQRWADYQERTATKLSEDWKAHNNQADTCIQYLKDNNMLTVAPGSNYAIPEYSTDHSTIKEQCKQVIVQNSWRMAFASDEDEFNSLLKEMQDTVRGLGYDEVYAVDEANCQDKLASYEAARQ